jgi:hypothetical protein
MPYPTSFPCQFHGTVASLPEWIIPGSCPTPPSPIYLMSFGSFFGRTVIVLVKIFRSIKSLAFQRKNRKKKKKALQKQ